MKNSVILYVYNQPKTVEIYRKKEVFNMTKVELASELAEAKGMTKKDSAEVVDIILQKIAGALEKGEDVSFTGFGTFKVKQRAARNGVNPATKEKIVIPPSKAVTFKVGKNLKEIVNG